MNTIVKDWQIVSVLDKGDLVGDVLWGICVDDSTYRFFKGDYICTSSDPKSAARQEINLKILSLDLSKISSCQTYRQYAPALLYYRQPCRQSLTNRRSFAV